MPNILIIDIDNPYSVQTILYSHEANVKHFVNVAFQREGNVIDVTNGYTVTADLVCNNVLIAQDVACTEVSIQGTPLAQINIAPADSSFTVPAGRLQIDFALTNISTNSVMHPVAPLIVRVMPAPAEHAQVNENSLGSYAEVVQEIADARGEDTTLGDRIDRIDNEIADARGEETTLGDRIDRIDGDVTTLSDGQLPDGRYMLFAEYGAVGTDLIANGAVNTSKLTNGAVTSEKLAANSVTTEKIVDSAVTEDKLADNSVTRNKIKDYAVNGAKISDYSITGAKIVPSEIDTAQLKNGAVTSDKLGAFAVTAGKIDGGAVGEAQLTTDAVTKTKIKDKAVTADKLDNVLQNFLGQVSDMLDWYTDTSVMSRVLVDDTVTSLSTLNTWTGTDGVYFFTVSGGAAGILGVDANTEAKMEYIGNYQVITFAVYNKKYYRLIESFAPTFVAGEWTLAV